MVDSGLDGILKGAIDEGSRSPLANAAMALLMKPVPKEGINPDEIRTDISRWVSAGIHSSGSWSVEDWSKFYEETFKKSFLYSSLNYRFMGHIQGSRKGEEWGINKIASIIPDYIQAYSEQLSGVSMGLGGSKTILKLAELYLIKEGYLKEGEGAKAGTYVRTSMPFALTSHDFLSDSSRFHRGISQEEAGRN